MLQEVTTDKASIRGPARGRRHRRPVGACRALCAALLLVTSGCLAPQAADEVVFHEDPATAREDYNAWTLFAHLGGALRLVASEEFDTAGEQMAAVHVERAHLPSSLVELATRYTDLCEELSTTIEGLYDSLDEAERMLAENDLPRAGLALGSSKALLTQARELLGALQEATREVLSLLRRSGSGTTSAELEEARKALDAALAQLTELTLRYEARLADIGAEAVEKQALVRPTVSLALARDAAWVGERVELSGAIVSGSQPLAGRTLSVLMDGVGVAEVRSDDRGLFRLDVEIPFEYVPRRVLQVAFRPGAGDLARFQPASSPEAVVTVRFHQSIATVEPPPRLYPGLPAALVGVVESTGSLGGRQVTVVWGEETVGNSLLGASGAIECTVLLPDDAPVGEGTLQVAVAGDDDAVTAPCTCDVDVEVSRLAPSMEVNVDRFLIVPALSHSLPRQLLGGDFVRVVPVSGEVSSSLPLDHVSLSAGWGEAEVSWQQDEVEFLRSVPLRTSVWSMGLRTVTVRAVPQEPWHRPAEARATLLVVNLFMPLVWLGAVLVALALGAASRRWWRAFSQRSASPQHAVPSLSLPLSPVPVAVAGGEGQGGLRWLVVELYYRAVALMQGTVGVALRREMTLREYLKAVSARFPAVLQAFSGLTALAERALYGRGEPDARDVDAGRAMLETMSPEAGGDDTERGEEPR